MARANRDGADLSGAEMDTLWCLFWNGPTQDGDLPSKSGRDSLVDNGWAFQHEGWQSLTEKGLAGAIRLGMDRKKEIAERARGRR